MYLANQSSSRQSLLLDWSRYIYVGERFLIEHPFNSIDKRHRKMQKLMSDQFRLDGRCLSSGVRGFFFFISESPAA